MNEEKSPICKFCRREIDELKYECYYTEYGIEYGTCNLEMEDYYDDERNSSEYSTEDHRHFCPHCDEELCDSDILYEGDDGYEEEEEEEEENLTEAQKLNKKLRMGSEPLPF
jgi:hypothetical protein